jgi:dihydroorotase
MSATAASTILITGGTVIDPAGERRVDVRIADGVVTDVEHSLSPDDGDRVIDASGQIVCPGFVDLHTHLREPGREEAETIETGSRAAAKGGYTCVVAMPNTDPTQDSVSVVEFVRAQGEAAGLCDVRPSGSITVGRRGEQLSPLAELADAGVHLFTDDGDGVQDPLLMRRALEYAADLDVVLAQHCEVKRLTEGAVMHEGHCCSKFGLPGWPSLAEELMVYRDIELVRITGAPLHVLHLSTAGSVELVRRAKADGLPVTAEATPHHISLTDELLADYSAIYKVNPPLRTMDDVEAVRAGLADGTIDAIATDHAPHAPETKEQPLDQAPPGMLGLETALGVSLASLLDTGMSVADVVAALSWKPAAIAGVADTHGRPVAVGETANLAVFHPGRTWQVVPAELASKSRNTPYLGRELRGLVTHTILAGEPTVENGTPTR